MGLKGVWDVGKRGSRLCYQNNTLKIYSIIKKTSKFSKKKRLSLIDILTYSQVFKWVKLGDRARNLNESKKTQSILVNRHALNYAPNYYSLRCSHCHAASLSAVPVAAPPAADRPSFPKAATGVAK